MSLRLFQWKRIPCRFSSNRCKGSLRLRTQRAFASLFFSASLLLCSFPPAADATQEDDIATIANILETWDQAGYVASTPYTFPFGMTIAEFLMYASGWSPSYTIPASETLKGLLGQILQKPSSAWSTNDVLAVLSALNGISSNLVSSSSGGFDSEFLTGALNDIHAVLDNIDYSTYGVSSWFGPLGAYLSQSSYADFFNSAPSNGWSSLWSALATASGEIHNVHQSDASHAGSHDSALRVVDANARDALDDINSTLGDMADSLEDLYNLTGTGLGIDQSGGGGILNSLDSIETHLYNLWNEASFIEDWTYAIHYDDLDYYWTSRSVQTDFSQLFGEMGYSSTSDRSVQQDFRFLQQQIGVEHPDPTNNIIALLRRFFASSEEEGSVSLTNAVLESQLQAKREEVEAAEVVVTNQVSNVATNSPDFDAHQYSESNPVDTGDNIFNLPRNQFDLVTPSLPDSSDRTIVLFQGGFPIFGGNGGTRSAARSVRLDISYPLADHDAVSNGVSMMRSIMEWVWQWVFLILSVRMLFAFYASLTESRNLMNSGVGGLTLN